MGVSRILAAFLKLFVVLTARRYWRVGRELLGSLGGFDFGTAERGCRRVTHWQSYVVTNMLVSLH